MSHDPDASARPGIRLSRRALLGTAALAGGTALVGRGVASAAPAAPAAAPAAAAPAAAAPSRHASLLRGLDVVGSGSRATEARFGLMFKQLPAHQPPDELLTALAGVMTEPGAPVDRDNPDITAGYTFLGQFIDHDMTLDRTPLGQQQSDPKGLTNFDSPLFDLASVYGRGPSADPDIYEPGGTGRLRVARTAEDVADLPRRPDGSAIIGDARNDENLIVAQLHLLFLQFHNRLLDSGVATSFADAQRLARWHFQWLIVHEFLPRVAGADVVARFLPAGATKVTREFYKPKNPNRPMMPVEYSGAAFRFGHSMIRAGYLLRVEGANRIGAPTFGAAGSDLRGSRPLPAALRLDWQHFFTVPGRPETPVNLARKIDEKLADPLFSLPPTVVSDGVVSLAERNLKRSRQLGLPSGQAVARAMGVTPLTNAQLGVPDPANPGWGGEAPLWFYVLAEAGLGGGRRLGEVGGRIVTETLLGILDADKGSYLNAKQPWSPTPPIARTAGTFTVGDLVVFATAT